MQLFSLFLFSIIFGCVSLSNKDKVVKTKRTRGTKIKCWKSRGVTTQTSPTEISYFPISPPTLQNEVFVLESSQFQEDSETNNNSKITISTENLEDFGNISFYPVDSVSDDSFLDSPGMTDADARILFLTNFHKFFIKSGSLEISDQIDNSTIANTYKLGHNWPESTDQFPQSQLSLRLMKLTLLSIINLNLKPHYLCLSRNIFDTSRPIIVLNESDNYITWLHLILNQAIINQDVLDIALAGLSKETLNHPDSNGVLPLHLAIRRVDWVTVQKLLVNGADCNQITNFSLNPFLYSIWLKSTGMYRLLLSAGKADPNITSLCGRYSFMYYVFEYNDLYILVEILNASTPLDSEFLIRELTKISKDGDDKPETLSNIIYTIWVHSKSSEALKMALFGFIVETNNMNILSRLPRSGIFSLERAAYIMTEIFDIFHETQQEIALIEENVNVLESSASLADSSSNSIRPASVLVEEDSFEEKNL